MMNPPRTETPVVQNEKKAIELPKSAYYGKEGVVNALLKECADINACNAYGGNALYAAYFRCDETIVRLLLENGPTVSANHGLYSTASRAAAYGGHEAIVRLFLDAGADANL